ncbi:hypothetical protein ABT160_27100 [Streptomyces sp. NPDC001941]|uniref:hypothetical protein n=1 Tax=Streptomyces sp. NPDC001941 TaxID=3154659 RepID=UPI00331EBA22
MPRSRRGLTTGPGAHSHQAHPRNRVIDGLSPSSLRDIDRLERSRNYLATGEVSASLRQWRDYVLCPDTEAWHAYEYGYPYRECCGDPYDARALLDTVLQALPPRSARQLRAVVARVDALWNGS